MIIKDFIITIIADISTKLMIEASHAFRLRGGRWANPQAFVGPWRRETTDGKGKWDHFIFIIITITFISLLIHNAHSFSTGSRWSKTNCCFQLFSSSLSLILHTPRMTEASHTLRFQRKYRNIQAVVGPWRLTTTDGKGKWDHFMLIITFRFSLDPQCSLTLILNRM